MPSVGNSRISKHLRTLATGLGEKRRLAAATGRAPNLTLARQENTDRGIREDTPSLVLRPVYVEHNARPEIISGDLDRRPAGGPVNLALHAVLRLRPSLRGDLPAQPIWHR